MTAALSSQGGLYSGQREQAQALAVAPKAFDLRTAAAAKDEEMAGMRVALQRLLDDQSQTVEALAHVGMAGRQPHSRPDRRSDERR
jgi:hypothetical protein